MLISISYVIRHTMLLLGLVVAACEAPAPPKGLVVGVIVIAETASSPPDLGPGAANTSLRFGSPGGPGGELIVARGAADPRTLDTVASVEEGMPVRLRPFSLQLPPGERQIRALAISKGELRVRQEPYMAGHWEWRERTRYDSATAISEVPLAPATFEVEPAKVTYIGRLGVLFDSVDHGWRPSMEALPCSRWQRERSAGGRAICVAREPFIGSDPGADLALIRQHYPRLAGLEIDVRPVKAPNGGWRSLAEAMRFIRINTATYAND